MGILSSTNGHAKGCVTLCIAALASFAGAEALGFTCTRVAQDSGASLSWASRTVTMDVSPTLLLALERESPSTVLAETEASLSEWSQVDCSDLVFRYGETVDESRAHYSASGHNHNVITALMTSWPYDRYAIAITTNAFVVRTGEILDSDIELNAVSFHFVRAASGCNLGNEEVDFQNTLTHELGHVLGLDHPPATAAYQSATMFANAPLCETQKQTLAEDDVDGICSIYPAGEDTQLCFPSESSALARQGDDGLEGMIGCSDSGLIGAPSEDAHASNAATAPASGFLSCLFFALIVTRRRRRTRRTPICIR
ncbi:MAG: matrixin family metalloprotease [Deltaproteobacteria bacterium]|nr:matrixin family metalloprotease [Deltaproteobacteria bacterium]